MAGLQKFENIAQFIYQKVIGFLPGGDVINDLIDLKGRIQQSRLNKFSKFLKEGFEAHTGEGFDIENLKTEDFIDALDAILRKVVSTKSEEKIKRYANVLLHKMFEKDDHEMFFKYLALIDDISETQILILQTLYLKKKNSDFSVIATELGIFHTIIDEDAPEGFTLSEKQRKQSYTLLSGNKLNYEEVVFCIKDLASKALLSSRNLKQMLSKIEVYEITAVGQEFIEFIKEHGSD